MVRYRVLWVVLLFMVVAGCDRAPRERASDADQHRLAGAPDARALDAWLRDKPRGPGTHFWQRDVSQSADEATVRAQYDQRLIVTFGGEATVAQVNSVLEHLQARIVGVSPPLQGAPTLYLEVQAGAKAKATEVAGMPGVTSAKLDKELLFLQADEVIEPLDDR